MSKQDRTKDKQNVATQARQIRQSNAIHDKARWQTKTNQGKTRQRKARRTSQSKTKATQTKAKQIEQGK